MAKRWTFELLKSEALKYKTKGEFKKKNRKAYFAATKRDDYSLIVKHMPQYLNRLGLDKARIKWTSEKLREEALKYKRRMHFARHNINAYQAALRMGKTFFNEICSHMVPSLTESYAYYELKEIANRFSNKNEFRLKNPTAYAAARKRDDYVLIVGHMPEYLDRRGENSPTFKWTNEMLHEEALKYNTRGQFYEESPAAYLVTCRRKILDTICSHMEKSRNSSRSESFLFDIIKSVYPKTHKMRDMKVKINNKPHIKGFDLDIYVPEKRKAIEFDGKYWHSGKGLKRSRDHWPQEDIDNYHKLKDDWFASKGIQILHIKEEEWIKDKEKCLKKCLDFLTN